MGFWLEILKSVSTYIGEASQPDVKIQIRQPNETIWRDFSYVSGNAESVQTGIELAASAYPDADVRAIDGHGGMRDFSR